MALKSHSNFPLFVIVQFSWTIDKLLRMFHFIPPPCRKYIGPIVEGWPPGKSCFRHDYLEVEGGVFVIWPNEGEGDREKGAPR